MRRGKAPAKFNRLIRQAVLSVCKDKLVDNPAMYFYVLVIGDEKGRLSGASGGGRFVPAEKCRNLNGKDMIVGIVDCLSRHCQALGGPAIKIIPVQAGPMPPDTKIV